MRIRIVTFLIALLSYSTIVAEDLIDSKFQILIDEATPIISALEEFRVKNGDFPVEVAELVPEYLAAKPDLYYTSSQKATNISSEEKDSWKGYQLRIPETRWKRASLFGAFLGTSSMEFLVYRPSDYYPERTYEKPKQRVGEWAIVEFYRSYAEDGQHTNPVLNDGV